MAFQVFKNKVKIRSLRIVYMFYWFLLAYILSALIFWFIALNNQNNELNYYKIQMVDVNDIHHTQKTKKLEKQKNSKTTQYIGEGITFLLLIAAGAIFVFRVIKRELVQSKKQYNFMMAITHELKTPIAVTKLNLETMQIRKLDYEQQQKLIRSTIQEANRLNALCNNMLLLSQIDTGGYTITNERFDLSTLANDCAEDFMERFPHRNIEVSAKEDIVITGDKLLLQLAINNLLDNAIKYSGKRDVIKIKVFLKNKKMILQVIDEGGGISPADKEKIFEKYFRGAQMQTKGTGLGLYLTKEIVKQHHGDIHMTNNNPRGCIFEIQFNSPKNS